MSGLPIRWGFEAVCRFGIAADIVAANIVAFLSKVGLEGEGCVVYETDIGSLWELPTFVSRVGKPYFRAEIGPIVVEMGGVRSFDHTLVSLESDDALPWRDLVGTIDGVVLSRAYDTLYNHWQNAEDPLVFQVAGRSMDGLPMKSNGLPFPLEQQVVDTSRNPGRRVLRQGYVEAIGHRMWLGPEYFVRVPGVDRDAILNAGWLRISELENGLLEINAADEPFVDDSTTHVQNRLRLMLFPTTV